MHPLEFRPGLRYVLERVVRSPRESVIKMHTSLQQDEDLSRTLISPSRRPRESTRGITHSAFPHRTAAVSMVAAGTNRPDQEFSYGASAFTLHPSLPHSTPSQTHRPRRRDALREFSYGASAFTLHPSLPHSTPSTLVSFGVTCRVSRRKPRRIDSTALSPDKRPGNKVLRMRSFLGSTRSL
jgi:hypothetical protein